MENSLRSHAVNAARQHSDGAYCRDALTDIRFAKAVLLYGLAPQEQVTTVRTQPNDVENYFTAVQTQVDRLTPIWRN